MFNLTTIKCLVLMSAAYIAGAYIFKKAYAIKETFRYLGLWLLPISVACITTNILLIYLSLLYVCFKIIPKDVESRAFYYLLLLPALPALPYLIPFPGINYIVKMDIAMFLSLAILLPAYLQLRHKKDPLYAPIAGLDWLVIAYIALTTFLFFRTGETITYWLRLVFGAFFCSWVPYFVLSRSFRRLDRPLLAIAFGASIMALLVIIEWRLNWKNYAILSSRVDGVNIPVMLYRNYFRGFGLRISGSWLDPISFGSFMAMAVFLNLFPSLWGHKRSVWSWALVGISALALLFTDSRAGQIMVVVCVGAVLFYGSRSSVWKSFLIVLGTFGLVALFISFDSLMLDDPEGTFQYRYNLIINSKDAFLANPWWGDPFFRDDPTLVATMTQGQGIVDIVNTYLSQALQFGIIAFILFVSVLTGTLRGYLSGLRKFHFGTSEHGATLALLCMYIGMLFLILTTSFMAYLQNYLWILISLGVAASRLAKAEK